eukprot:scaffold4725_cov367-Prasinococcus_capsulatus_cf.AAC.5
MSDSKRPGDSNADSRPSKKPFGGSAGEDDMFEDFQEDDFTPVDEYTQMAEDYDVSQPEGIQVSALWSRKPVPEISPADDNILFQQLDIDYTIGGSHPKHSPELSGQCPVLRAFGVTSNGNSVCVHIHGFEPYFYIMAPAGFTTADCESLKKTLNGRLDLKNGTTGVRRVEIEQKQTLWQYQREKSQNFLKVVTALPNQVATCRNILERGVDIPGISQNNFLTYESNVVFTLRFMVDCKISGGNWLELPSGSYSLRAEEGKGVHGIKPKSRCQIEADIRFCDLVSHPSDGEHSGLAPFRILSVDIECAGREGHFPEAQHDPVIQIASILTEQGNDKPTLQNILTLKECAPIPGVQVMSFEEEKDLLLQWKEMVLAIDPDVIIGYNTDNFDLPYLIDRAEALSLSEFPYWGRMKGSKLRMRDTTFSSKAYGTRENKEITIEGRFQFDLIQAIRRDYKLSSYSLNSVSAHFLGEQKEDVHHSIITDLQNGNPETRRRLAVYCVKDALLPQRLLDKLMYVYNYIEMARVTGVPISFLLSRGQSIKVMSQILRKAQERNLLVPNMKSNSQSSSEGGVAYEGATVLDAKTGYYQKPIATLDFASLYPSIMMAHNLCYCTLVHPRDVKDFPPDSLSKTPCGDYFVKPDLCKGILPEILEQLLGARKRAKGDLKKETDPFKKAVLNGRQLALKVSANSVYGFTGATVGQLPCLQISAGTTAYGRNMIDHTKKLVMETYNRKNGYEADADVIYGDTDSVMVNFNFAGSDKEVVEKSMKLGEEAAAFISNTFPKPIKLEFEKVYFPYLLMSKKRYVGLVWTNPEKFDKMDSKGIETVRRDNCLLVRDLVTTVLNKILIERNVDAAIEYVKSRIADLLMNRTDMSHLVVTKALSKAGENYKNIMPHVELAKRMEKRDPATAPKTGDRVAYVIIKGVKGALAHEKAEDPIYALEHNLPIDTQHYLEHHLKAPLTRIFEPIMKNVGSLFAGYAIFSEASGIPVWPLLKLSELLAGITLETSPSQPQRWGKAHPAS